MGKIQVPLEDALSREDLEALASLGKRATEVGTILWIVGGAVRDAFLGRPVMDIDLASDKFAPDLVKMLGVTGRSRSQFASVKVQVGSRIIDLASARSETYKHPGALPSITMGTMASDLARRDFSINAMAASLAPEHFGELLDPFGGFKDLQSRIIRGLHAETFKNDATRMIRAARYTARLRFHLHPETERWLRRDTDYLGTISAARIHRELNHTLAEPSGVQALLTAHKWGILRALHAPLGVSDVPSRLRHSAHDGVAGGALLGVLLADVEPKGAAAALGLTKKERQVVTHVHRLLQEDALAIPQMAVSHAAAVIGDAPIAAVEAIMAIRSAETRRNLRRWRRRAQIRPHLNGRDLLALGVPAGKCVGSAMQALQFAVLDGKARTRRGEKTFVRGLLSREDWR